MVQCSGADPLRVVAFGGGTGLPALLRGLRGRPGVDVTAVVTVADDGGSSGRLRDELHTAPPGDIRNCLIALAADERLATAFAHRFGGEGELRGHALGNLILAGLTGVSGDFCDAVAEAGRLLQVQGAVHPAAREALTLVTHADDGTIVLGEASTAQRDGALVRVEAVAPVAAAPPAVLDAIAAADAVVLSAGSLFTSTIAALLGAGTREALASFDGPVIYVANLLTQRGETIGFTVSDHVRAITGHGAPPVSDVVVPAERGCRRAQARRPGAVGPVAVDGAALARLGVAVHRVPRLAVARPGGLVHDPRRLGDAVLAVTGDDLGADPRPALSKPAR